MRKDASVADYTSLVGFAAGILTTLSLFPQIVRTYRLRKAKELSPIWIATLACGTFLWALYGMLINSLPVLVANLVSFFAVLVLACLKFKYK